MGFENMPICSYVIGKAINNVCWSVGCLTSLFNTEKVISRRSVHLLACLSSTLLGFLIPHATDSFKCVTVLNLFCVCLVFVSCVPDYMYAWAILSRGPKVGPFLLLQKLSVICFDAQICLFHKRHVLCDILCTWSSSLQCVCKESELLTIGVCV